jgi:hypothetical protein
MLYNDKTMKSMNEMNNDFIADVSKSIPKRHNHDHFWIENGILYESYSTIRGMRYMEVMRVHGMSDEEKCNDACLVYIAKEYCL